jgi:IS605 OrfB family transposase
MVIATKKSAKAIGKPCSVPVFKGKAVLDSRHVIVEDGEHAFDLIVKLSTLKSGNRTIIPTKHTTMTRKWLSKPNAKFIQGCALSESSLTLWVDVPVQSDKQDGRVIGIDMGVNKLMADSDCNFYGRDFKSISSKIRRKKPKSEAKQRAIKERDNFIGRAVNQLPWSKLKAIGVEDLTGIKTGKKKNRGRQFRKAMAPWIVRQVVNRISNKASENRVRLIKVNPTNTSRTCPICGGVSKENRKGEMFQCIACGYKGDADHIGALNILAKTFVTLGRLQSPRQRKEVA